jgi:cobalt-zinc-cadmium efflux system membrane fusion protein
MSYHMAARALRIVVLIAVLGGLGGLAYWAWEEGQAERAREATRELSIKEPSRRIIDPKTQEVVLQLDGETQQRLGLVMEPLKRMKWQKTLTLLGFTVAVPHRLAEVRSPWTGVLEAPAGERMPTVGQKISKGQLLGNLLVQWSPSDRISLETQLRDVRGTITETEAQIRVAKSTVERLRKIGEQVVASKLLIEAEGTLAQLEARLSAANAREKDLQEALAKQAPEFRFRLTAPQSGQLTELGSRPGEVVSAGSVVATIYDSQELWITVSALPSALPLEEIPDEAQITLPGFQGKPLPARLVRVKTHIVPQQQGVELVYGTTNPGGLVPVGLQAEARIRVGQPKDVVQVPQSAVVQLNNRRLVYLERAVGEFVKQFVEVEGEESGMAHLRPTLPETAKMVVTRGAQTLLSEEYKESIQLVEEGAKPSTSEAGKSKEK